MANESNRPGELRTRLRHLEARRTRHREACEYTDAELLIMRNAGLPPDATDQQIEELIERHRDATGAEDRS